MPCRFIMGSHKRAIDAYTEAEKISSLPDWEIYYGLGKLFFSMHHSCIVLAKFYETFMNSQTACIGLKKIAFYFIFLFAQRECYVDVLRVCRSLSEKSHFVLM